MKMKVFGRKASSSCTARKSPWKASKPSRKPARKSPSGKRMSATATVKAPTTAAKGRSALALLHFVHIAATVIQSLFLRVAQDAVGLVD